jgi:hypothetical protein
MRLLKFRFRMLRLRMSKFTMSAVFALLSASLFAATCSAQVGQQPNRNRRSPASGMPPTSNGQQSDQSSNAQDQSYSTLPPGEVAAATEALNRTYIAMTLRKPDSPPFHLLAKVHYEVADQAQDGTYELFWAGTQHFREVFQLGGAQETDVAIGEKLYVSRTSVTVTLPLHNVREFIRSPLPGTMMVDYDVTGAGPEQVNGQQLNCVHVVKREATTSQQATEEACFDAQSNEVVSIRAEGNLLDTPTGIQLGAFKTLGAKRYPMQMTSIVPSMNMPSAKIDVTIETLEDVKQFDGDPMTPPQGALERDWCLTLATAPSLQDSSQPAFPQEELKNLSEFYVLVNANGRVVEAEPVRPAADPTDEQKIADWLKTARYPIQNCGTTPVEYETFYVPQLKRVY